MQWDLHTIINIIVPIATSIMIVRSQANPIHPIGSTVTLTCSVELSPVDVPVNVTIVWAGPAMFRTDDTVTENTITYTSMAIINSFGRDQSGDYNCSAIVFSVSPFLIDSDPRSEIIRVTAGIESRLLPSIFGL